jgi:hypothetical protein
MDRGIFLDKPTRAYLKVGKSILKNCFERTLYFFGVCTFLEESNMREPVIGGSWTIEYRLP